MQLYNLVQVIMTLIHKQANPTVIFTENHSLCIVSCINSNDSWKKKTEVLSNKLFVQQCNSYSQKSIDLPTTQLQTLCDADDADVCVRPCPLGGRHVGNNGCEKRQNQRPKESSDVVQIDTVRFRYYVGWICGLFFHGIGFHGRHHECLLSG